MRFFALLAAITFVGIVDRAAIAIDPYAGNDPFWVLLHEPAVIDDLQMSTSQAAAYSKMLNELDLRFFPLRNRSQAEAVAGIESITRDVRDRLDSLLQPKQDARLNEILRQFLGISSLLRDDVSSELRLSESQRKRIKEITIETETAISAANRDSNATSVNESKEKTYFKLKTDEQKKILALLKPEQLESFKNLIGSPFPLNKLRKPGFRTPDFIDTGEWINSKPIKRDQLMGKVVVVHFYACGCINCIHNYPSYRQWQDQYKGKNVVLVGVHTPETQMERDTTFVRRKAAEEKLAFPILIDGKQENWNAWGNSMWPSVYLIDKRGNLRDFWPGELKWQGTDGEKYMRERIEELLAEPNP